MTAFIGLVSRDYAIIGSDTLATYPRQGNDTDLRPRSYTSKTFILPHFKSAFAVTGTLQLGVCFFNLIVELAYGIDICSLTSIDLRHFHQKLRKDYDSFPTGSIYLFGYSDIEKRFKGFKLVVELEDNLEWQRVPHESLIFKPAVNNWRNKLSAMGDIIDYSKLIVELMKIQKQEDEQKEPMEQVGIGGQIVITQLGFEESANNITIVTRVAHQFDDYVELGNKMTIESKRQGHNGTQR